MWELALPGLHLQHCNVSSTFTNDDKFPRPCEASLIAHSRDHRGTSRRLGPTELDDLSSTMSARQEIVTSWPLTFPMRKSSDGCVDRAYTWRGQKAQKTLHYEATHQGRHRVLLFCRELSLSWH